MTGLNPYQRYRQVLVGTSPRNNPSRSSSLTAILVAQKYMMKLLSKELAGSISEAVLHDYVCYVKGQLSCSQSRERAKSYREWYPS